MLSRVHWVRPEMVVEVNFDLDANSPHFARAACGQIEDTVATVLREGNHDLISNLKIVHRGQQSADRHPDATAAGHGAKSSKTAPGEGRSSAN